MTIGDERSINAWSDNWLEPRRNFNEYQVQIPKELKGVRVSDLVDENGEWNWSLLQDWMPQVLMCIMSPSQSRL